MQRKLLDEDTSFQKQLNGTRELLAKNYLKNTDMSSDDIAFLLGYQEINSFLRAFSLWTGMSVSEYKRMVTHGEIVLLDHPRRLSTDIHGKIFPDAAGGWPLHRQHYIGCRMALTYSVSSNFAPRAALFL